jgi:hypothetical protein
MQGIIMEFLRMPVFPSFDFYRILKVMCLSLALVTFESFVHNLPLHVILSRGSGPEIS